MPSLIREIVCAARKTFSLVSGDQFDEGMSRLKSLLCRLRASDIGITASDMHFPHRFLSFRPPVKFMTIREEPDFTVTAFIVSHNQKIPLHDHPEMHGVIKCIAGRIRVTSYSKLPLDRTYVLPTTISTRVPPSERQNLIPCLKLEEVQVTADDEKVLCLTPEKGNIHEVAAESESSAFVDVLGPPYNDESDCHYYTAIGSAVDRGCKQEITWLLPVHPPPNYFTEVIPYRGPNVA